MNGFVYKTYLEFWILIHNHRCFLSSTYPNNLFTTSFHDIIRDKYLFADNEEGEQIVLSRKRDNRRRRIVIEDDSDWDYSVFLRVDLLIVKSKWN